jgi:Tol biopolymer transport system component
VMTDRAKSTIWLVDVQTGEQMQIAGNDGNAFAPRWSPNGKRLAYASTEGGSPQIWVRWVDRGQSVRLTGLPTAPSSLTWSPDSASIAYTMMVKDEELKLGSAQPSKPEGALNGPSRLSITTSLHTAQMAKDICSQVLKKYS